MKNFKFPLLALIFLFMLASCEKDSFESLDEQSIDETVLDASLELTEDVLTTLKTNNFNIGEVDIIDFHLPDGTIQKRYQLEGDITMSRAQMEQLIALEGNNDRNYYTNNLVSRGTITIVGFTGSGFALSSKERTALQYAVNNYNRLNLEIRFSLSFGTNFQNSDMVVYNNEANNPDSSGGSAGFPSNGNPNKFVQIYGLSGFSTDVNEHVITHEIGHSVGFRHTDWFSRQSCGQNTNEGTAGVGANPIPGTPAGFDPTSIMVACFSNNENGEFNANDRTALRFLY